MVVFCELGFDVMPYPFAFVYASECAPNGFMLGCLKNAVQFAELAKWSKWHPEEFKLYFKSQISSIESTYKRMAWR